MTTWSGLAPAVDAHLARWSIIKRIAEMTAIPPPWREIGREPTRTAGREWAIKTIKEVSRTDAGFRWLSFAKSYGLPGPDPTDLKSSFTVVGSDGTVATAMDDEGHLITNDEGHQVQPSAFFQDTAIYADGATISGREQFNTTDQSLVTGVLMIQREFRMLDTAVSHYISAEVVDEVTWAAEEAFPEPLFETDLFTPAGFAVLEKPLHVVDLHPDTGLVDPRVHIQIRAIGWHRHPGIMSPTDETIGEGVTLFLYTTPDDYRDGYVREADAAFGRDILARAADNADVDGPFMPVEVIPWRFGVEWSPRSDDVNYHVPGTVPTPVAYQRRWFFALMRLMWQEIIVRHTTHEPRHTHRRWERLAKRKELLDYTTLRLRRVVDPTYEPTGMGLPLDHRVKVRAHWRRVYVPSIGGPARLPDGTMDPTNHRLVWIEEHWRGPEDGPIGAMHSATSVVR